MKMSFEIAARTRQAKWAICCSCRECNSNSSSGSSSRHSNKKFASGEAADNGGDLRFLAVRASDKGRGAQCPKRSLITGTSSGNDFFFAPPLPALHSAVYPQCCIHMLLPRCIVRVSLAAKRLAIIAFAFSEMANKV